MTKVWLTKLLLAPLSIITLTSLLLILTEIISYFYRSFPVRVIPFDICVI